MILTLFYIFAFVMMALFGFVLLKTVLSPAAQDETNHRDVNIGIARDRKSLIKDALSKGNIDKDTYEQELKDIETTLADELTEGPNNTQSRIMRGLGVFVILGTLIAVSVTLYQQLGSAVAMQNQYLAQTGSVILPNGATANEQIALALESGMDPRSAVEQVNAASAQPQAESIETLLPQLEARVAENPDDVEGGMLLARTYLNVGEYKKAEDTLLKLYETEDTEPELIIMLAESTALQFQGALTGKPQELIAKALQLDPNNQRGMLLMGLSHQQEGEHAKAIEILERLQTHANLSADGEQNIRRMIAQSLAVMNEPENPKENAPLVDANNGSSAANTTTSPANTSNSATASNSTTAQEDEEASTPSLSVSIELSETAKASAGVNDSVFVFAVASNGPPMPLAAVRIKVSDLPTTIVLDNTQAMIPDMTLSAFPSVTVGARVSAAGDAIAKPGDWFGEQTNVSTVDEPGTAVQITIDQQTP